MFPCLSFDLFVHSLLSPLTLSYSTFFYKFHNFTSPLIMTPEEAAAHFRSPIQWFTVLTNVSCLIPVFYCFYYGFILEATVLFAAGFMSFFYHLADSMDVYRLKLGGYDNYQYADFVLSTSLFGSVTLFLILFDGTKCPLWLEIQIRGALQYANLFLVTMSIKKKRFGIHGIYVSLGFAALCHVISWIAFLWFPLAQYDWYDFIPGIMFILLACFCQYKACSGCKSRYPLRHALWHLFGFIGISFLLDMRTQERTFFFFQLWENPYNGRGEQR